MKLFGFLAILFLSTQAVAQSDDDHWEAYLAQYEKGTGSALVNFSLKKLAPVKAFVFLLKAGVKIKQCTEDGLPTREEWKDLYDISDKVKAIVKANGAFKYAGVFTYQCRRTDYYYITDTMGIREKLTTAFNDSAPGREFKVEMKADPQWEAYLTFLYPNEETMEFISNQKVVLNLVKAGDNLAKPRQVDHWLYFRTEAGRNQFVKFALLRSYKVEGQEFSSSGALHFQLHLSRTEDVSLPSISTITLELRRKAKEFEGEYDGWETFVIKE
jgi:Family of unknown function (DUF695)/Regulator of ribonuclease activity B